MRILAMSDMHGQLPVPATLPEHDILILTGDNAPDFLNDRDKGVEKQRDWYSGEFTDWLLEIQRYDNHIVWIGGNHDFGLEGREGEALARSLPGEYLLDSHVVIGGLKVYGTPWVPNLPVWAF